MGLSPRNDSQRLEIGQQQFRKIQIVLVDLDQRIVPAKMAWRLPGSS